MVIITCPKSDCGNTWDYRGKATPGQYVCCPACSTRFRRPFRRVLQTKETGLSGRCQVCGEEADLSIVYLDDGETLLACGKCVQEGKF